jgi:RND superfamily putative drug exporter
MVAIWMVALVAALAAIVLLLGSSMTGEAELERETEATRAERLLEDSKLVDEQLGDIVIIRSEQLTVADPAFRRAVEGLAAKAEALGRDVVARGTTYYRSKDPRLVSADRHATVLPFRLEDWDRLDDIERLIAEVERDPRFTAYLYGGAIADADFKRLSSEDLRSGELYGLIAAAVVLILVFGALVAAVLPVLLALIAIVVTLGLAALVGQAYTLSFFVVNIVAALGLALGIDYALLIVSRFREERGRGRPRDEALAVTGATASRAVLFSGALVVLALIGMLFAPDSGLRSLGIGAVLTGAVTVVAALTLLPAVIALLGDRVNAGRVPLVSRSGEQAEGRFWSAVARKVMARPVIALILGGWVLIGLALPAVTFETATSGVSALPERTESHQAFEAIERDFSAGLQSPARIVLDGEVRSPQTATAIRRLERELRGDPDFGRPEPLRVDRSGTVGMLSVPVEGDPRLERATGAVRRLRGEYIPRAFAGAPVHVGVTGRSAFAIDYVAVNQDARPWVFAFVLGMSFLVLTVVFRSIVVPLKAIVLNLLSVFAAYGVLALVFQHGIGAELLGLQQVEGIEPWIPLFLFCILFGLSMDYHVFLLSRIRERYLADRDNDEAVARGLAATARIITGAALIIVTVFAGLALGDLVMFQQVGFGVGVALLLDATLIRAVLVPAAMTLLGHRNWYLPRWLHWLPELQRTADPVAPSAPAPASGAGSGKSA